VYIPNLSNCLAVAAGTPGGGTSSVVRLNEVVGTGVGVAIIVITGGIALLGGPPP
jgi:hypothetical protein